MAPERTFWEKVSLLHEEIFPPTGPRARLARHHYDLWCLDQRGIAKSAMATPELFERVREHRELFFPGRAEARKTLTLGTVCLVPSPERMRGWRTDFDAMRDSMFFEEPPPFETIMDAIGELEERINRLPRVG